MSIYKEWLSEFKALSVREKSGADIIFELTGRKAEILLDPTLTLNKESWIEISCNGEILPEKDFIMTYFLGEMDNNLKKYINKIAEENNLEIINFGDVKNKDTYILDPSSFIAHIREAKIIFTDSFHGVAFSIIFNKPFLVFERLSEGPSMYTRIDNILSIFGLQFREFKGNYDIDDILNVDYSAVNDILEHERQRSINYLQKALDSTRN